MQVSQVVQDPSRAYAFSSIQFNDKVRVLTGGASRYILPLRRARQQRGEGEGHHSLTCRRWGGRMPRCACLGSSVCTRQLLPAYSTASATSLPDAAVLLMLSLQIKNPLLSQVLISDFPRKYRLDTSGMLHHRRLIEQYGGWRSTVS